MSHEEHEALAHVAVFIAAKYEHGDIQMPLSPLEVQGEHFLFKATNHNLVFPNFMNIIRFISWEMGDSCEQVRAIARVLLIAAVHEKGYSNYSCMTLAIAAMTMANKMMNKTIVIPEDFGTMPQLDCYEFLKNSFLKWNAVAAIRDIESTRSRVGLVGLVLERLAHV
jgi:hypothetical protein